MMSHLCTKDTGSRGILSYGMAKQMGAQYARWWIFKVGYVELMISFHFDDLGNALQF